MNERALLEIASVQSGRHSAFLILAAKDNETSY